MVPLLGSDTLSDVWNPCTAVWKHVPIEATRAKGTRASAKIKVPAVNPCHALPIAAYDPLLLFCRARKDAAWGDKMRRRTAHRTCPQSLGNAGF
jgi:hypothetical protein